MYYYIINPTAGRGAINQLQEKLRARLKDLGISGEFAKTTGPGEASQMARTAIAKGYKTIVAVGGDETVNEVINGISGNNVAVGIIPIGKSNILAHKLGIFSWQQACEVLAARRLSSFGLIAAGQHFFLSTLTLGFETDLDKRMDSDESDWRSRLGQFKKSWGHASNFTPLKCSLQLDDNLEVDCSIFTLSVSNQKFLNPLAENKLVVSIFDKPTKRLLTSYLWQLVRKKEPLEEVATSRFTANRIIIDTKPTTGIMIDGKLAGRTPIAIRLTDKRIRFICEKPDSAFRPS